MAVQGDTRRPKTAPRLTMVSIMIILCSQMRGMKNHKVPTASAIIIEGMSGIQKT